MILSKTNLSRIDGEKIDLPHQGIFTLPEKVLQFGTGVFIRSFADYFIDKANKKGDFNGRVVVVKSTNTGSSAEFDTQDGLYTVCSKGIELGSLKEEYSVNAAISRVLIAGSQWDQILQCAHNPEMNLVISNTTEVGIQLVKEKIGTGAPASFPAKLLAFLLERHRVFNGSEAHGMVILPTELIPDNGVKLKEIVLELAQYNEIDKDIIDWIDRHNSFCNSLVDRIVPGKPGKAELNEIQSKIGYSDDLLSVSELFSLWAIEGDEKIKKSLSFSISNPGVVIAENIGLYRELKLRLLNGTHTFNCGLAFLAGFQYTRDAFAHSEYKVYASKLMHEEIAAAIPYEIDPKVKADYANQVAERFLNPYIDHQWISITAQFSFKMKMRNVPLLLQYYKLFNKVPLRMAAGFAGYILFMKSVKEDNGRYWGVWKGEEYMINDDNASKFNAWWKNDDYEFVVSAVLSDEELWGQSLKHLEGFENTVCKYLKEMTEQGVMPVLQSIDADELVIDVSQS